MMKAGATGYCRHRPKREIIFKILFTKFQANLFSKRHRATATLTRWDPPRVVAEAAGATEGRL